MGRFSPRLPSRERRRLLGMIKEAASIGQRNTSTVPKICFWKYLVSNKMFRNAAERFEGASSPLVIYKCTRTGMNSYPVSGTITHCSPLARRVI